MRLCGKFVLPLKLTLSTIRGEGMAAVASEIPDIPEFFVLGRRLFHRR
jgi:hypothetical protein